MKPTLSINIEAVVLNEVKDKANIENVAANEDKGKSELWILYHLMI